jgi:hypothetical protein
MSGAIPSLPNTPSWRGAQLKSQGQLYLYLILSVHYKRLEETRIEIEWRALSSNPSFYFPHCPCDEHLTMYSLLSVNFKRDMTSSLPNYCEFIRKWKVARSR